MSDAPKEWYSEEIVRLHAEIERLRGIEQVTTEASRHERDGLRAEVARLQHLYKIGKDQCAMLYNEVERLKAQIKAFHDDMAEYCCTATDQPCGCYDKYLSEKAEIERLDRQCMVAEQDRIFFEEEIARLRALLRPFVDMAAEPEDFAAARRELEGK